MPPEKITKNLNSEQHNTEKVNDVQPSIENDRESIIIEDVQEELKQIREDIKIIEKFTTPDINLDKPLTDNQIINIIKNLKDLQLADENKTAIIQKLIDKNHGNKIIEYFNVFDLQNAEKVIIIKHLANRGYKAEIMQHFTNFALSNIEDIESIIDQFINSGNGWMVAEQFKNFTCSESEKLQDIVINKLIKSRNTRSVINYFKNFTLSEDDKVSVIAQLIDKGSGTMVAERFQTFELQKKENIKHIITQLIDNNCAFSVINNFQNFILSENDKISIITQLIDKGNKDMAIEHFKNFELTTTESIQNIITRLIDNNHAFSVISHFQNFKLPENAKTSIITQLIDKGSGWDVILYLNNFNIHEAEKDKIFNDEKMSQIQQEMNEKCQYDIKQYFSNPPISPKNKIQKITNLMNSGYTSYVLCNFQELNITNKEEIEPIIAQVIKEGKGQQMARCFKNLNINTKHHNEIVLQLLHNDVTPQILLDNIQNFNINAEQLYNLAKESPKLKKNIEVLEYYATEFSLLIQQMKKSPNVLIDILIKKDMSTIIQVYKNQPCLRQALIANPRFGVKLLQCFISKTPESQEKIQLLYELKNDILQENPEIKTDSVEFRIIMQNKLKNFANNAKILQTLNQKGLNVDSWLNYQQSLNFNIKDQVGTQKQELHSQEIDDIINTYINTLQKTIYSVLGNIPQPIHTRILSIKSLFKNLKSTDKHIPNIKNKLKKKFSELNNESLVNILKQTTATEQQIHNITKQLTAQLPKNYQTYFQELEERLQHYKPSANPTQRNINRQTKNYSINIASRNPDVDLYLANYCPCCISIENLRGTTADYSTDLGMQNIILYAHEDTEKIPVAVCWCYIGEKIDNNDGLYFVVDNVETNEDYSKPNYDVFVDQLQEYIINYAAKCGINESKIVQGDYNNDLYIFTLNPKIFKKASPYNGRKYNLDSVQS